MENHKTLMVATPMYGAVCTGQYTDSMIALVDRCYRRGVNLAYATVRNDSLVPRARNRLADMFLGSIAEYMIFIDADIEFNPDDVMSLLDMDKDIVAVPYPKKKIEWRRVKEVILKNPDVPPDYLEKLAGSYVANARDEGNGGQMWRFDKLTSIKDTGTGFMMIKRHVFEKLRASGEVKPYVPMRDEKASTSGGEMWDFFATEIDADTKEYLSEDYAFCRKWRRLGGEVFIAAWMNLNHYGMHCYIGDMQAIANSGVGL